MKIAIIGGSGLYKMDGLELVKEHVKETPFGGPSSPIREFKTQDGYHFYFLTRHGDGHVVSPSEINYLANIFALKSLDVTHVISVSAVGSLREDLAPGDFFFQ